jgi:predicted O-linked N-acetylglucosamine transferase (SPINDLY family)
MATLAEALDLALQHHQAGRLQEAEALYRQILLAEPKHPDALHLLGVIAHQVGRHHIAVDYICRAIGLNPAVAEFHFNLGEAYRAQGRLEEAVVAYRQALALKPAFAEACNNLGNALKEQGKLDEAVASYRQAVALQPTYAEALNNLGNALKDQGKLEEAVASFRQALALRPEYAVAHNNLGVALQWQGKLEEAVAAYRQALSLKPAFAEAYNNLGNVLQEQRKLEEAEANYRHALTLKPAFAEAFSNLGAVLQEQGSLEEAVAAYRQALALRPNDGIRIKVATILPVIIRSREDIPAVRRQYDENLTALLKGKLTLTDPVREVGQTNFYLAYHGQNDRELQIKMAQAYERACPSLSFESPCSKSGGRVKIGFVSKNFCTHTIGKLMRGIIAQLSRSLFSVTVFSFSRQQDPIADFIERQADRMILLPSRLEDARYQIAREQPDILFYPDIGMDALTYFLAYSRLAPIQCVTWGHPVTTGIRTIDYFISSEYLEPENADQHYSERLVRLQHLPTYYYRPEIATPLKSRSGFGLDNGRTVYLCPQSLFKIHPDLDDIVAGILRADRQGVVILIDGYYRQWNELLLNRFRKAMPEVVDRIRFVPRQSRQDFLALLSSADVILDPPHWSGGNTTYEALSLGIPIVTMPSGFMRGRVTYACYKLMGVMDCVAGTKEEYVDLAVRLGANRKYRAEIKAKILAANNVLYENAEAVRDLERFLVKAVGATRRSR